MPQLSDEEIKRIAEAAATAAIQKTLDGLYQEVGRTIIKRALWALGIAAVLFAMWLTKGHGQ